MQVLWIVISLALFALTVCGLINTSNNKNSVSPIINKYYRKLLTL